MRQWPRMRTAVLAATLGLCAALQPLGSAAVASGVAPGRYDDPRQEREEVRRRQADAAAQVDTLRATSAEVGAALDAIEANVRGTEATLTDARRTAELALRTAEIARAEELEAEAELTRLADELRSVAVFAYVHPNALGGSALDMLAATDMNRAVQRRKLIEIRAGGNLDITDRAEAARQDLELRRRAADDAAAKATEEQQAVEAALAEAEAAQAQHQQFAADVESRLNATLAESAALAALDKELSDRIAAEEAALAARAAAAAAAARRTSSGGGTGGGTVIGPIALATVRGITVAAQIADELEGLLAAAEDDGLILRGGGYRSQEAQIALRKAHCGTSDYAIWQMPASQCSPPTAIPGTSMHERGLAIDFTYNGAIISSRSNPAFQWLARHAAAYGFYNLPSEPWHWSTNGQ